MSNTSEFKAETEDLYLNGNDKESKICELSNKFAELDRQYDALKTECSFYEKKLSDVRTQMSSLKKDKTNVKRRIESIQMLTDNVTPIYEFDQLIEHLKSLKIVDHLLNPRSIDLEWKSWTMNSPLGEISLYGPKYAYEDFYIFSVPNANKANKLIKILKRKFVVNKDYSGCIVLYGVKL